MIPALCARKGCGKLANKRCTECLEPYCSPECQRTDWPEHKPYCWEKLTGLNPTNSRRSGQGIFVKFASKLLALASVPLEKKNPSGPSVQWRTGFILRGIRLLRNFVGADRRKMSVTVGWHIPHDPIYLQTLVCLAQSNAQVLEVGAGLGFLAAVARALGVTWKATDAMNGWGSTKESKHWIPDMHHQTALKAAQTWKPHATTAQTPLVLAAAWFPAETACVDDLKSAAEVWLKRFPTRGVVLLIGDPTPRKDNYATMIETLIPELDGSDEIKQCLQRARDTTADPAMFKHFAEKQLACKVTVQAPYPLFPLRTYPGDAQWAFELTGGLVGDQYTFVHSPEYAAALFSTPLLSQSAQCKPSSTFRKKFIVPIVAEALVTLPMDLCSIIVRYAFIVVVQ